MRIATQGYATILWVSTGGLTLARTPCRDEVPTVSRFLDHLYPYMPPLTPDTVALAIVDDTCGFRSQEALASILAAIEADPMARALAESYRTRLDELLRHLPDPIARFEQLTGHRLTETTPKREVEPG